MFTSIKTSGSNRENVTLLTSKFNLGAENVIARIAIAYSLHSGATFSPLDIKDSTGKEYSKNVLFGAYYPVFLSLICTRYRITNKNKDIPRYIKAHLDHGLEMIATDVKKNPNLVGFDYLLDKITIGLQEIC